MLRAWLKTHSTRGTWQALRQLRSEVTALRIHRDAVRRLRAHLRAHPPEGKLRIHLGCGKNIKPGWLNVDQGIHANFRLDLREDLPLPDGCAEMVYSEHFFEHLAYPDEVSTVLRESFRVLRPGGTFSVGVPDTVIALKSYVDRDDAFFVRSLERGFHPAWCTTRMHQINYHFRQGTEHKYCYDFETLRDVLEAAGFTDVREREWDPQLDSEARRWGTMYVDATRPERSG